MQEDSRQALLKACDGLSQLSIESLLLSLRENIDPFYSPAVLTVRKVQRPTPIKEYTGYFRQPETVVQWSKDSPFQRVVKAELGKRTIRDNVL